MQDWQGKQAQSGEGLSAQVSIYHYQLLYYIYDLASLNYL